MKNFLSLLGFFLVFFNPIIAQKTVNDKLINNLMLPSDIKTVGIGSLGNVQVVGEGEQNILLIAGWGFGTNIFKGFVNSNYKNYKMHLITLPGFGNTSPQDLPSPNVSYGEQAWTNGCIRGIVDYVKKHKLKKVSVIAYFNIATQIVLRLNMEHSELVDKTVVVGGSMTIIDPQMEFAPTLQQRIDINDKYYAPKWFKTVTQETWNSSNFSPQFYSLDSLSGNRLWDEVASVPIPVMVQYLCEFNSQDVTLDLEKLKKPLLSIVPGYSKEFFNDENQMADYIKTNYIDQWQKLKHPLIKVQTIQGSGNCVFVDKPHIIDRIINEFFQ